MTAFSLKVIVAQSLAEIGIPDDDIAPSRERSRTTRWLPHAHGIGIRSYPSGRSVYIAQARMDGRQRTVTIGSAAVLSEAQAIDVARRVLARVLIGDNPADTRQRARAAPTYLSFLDEFWRKVASRWKPSTREKMAIYRKHYLDDAFADLTIDAISETDVARWFARLSDRCGPGGANRCMAILNSMMRKADDWGYRPEGSNPCRLIRRNRARPRERFLSETELARLAPLLAAARASVNRKQAACASAVTLLLLTGCRRQEVVDLEWGDVRGSRLRLRDTKTGPRTVWLGRDAAVLLAELPRLKKVRFVFSDGSRKIAGHDASSAWQRMRVEAGVADARLHDLRHTFASHAAMTAETLPMIGKLLGHATVQSTARYAHLDDSHLSAAVLQLGDIISRMMV